MLRCRSTSAALTRTSCCTLNTMCQRASGGVYHLRRAGIGRRSLVAGVGVLLLASDALGRPHILCNDDYQGDPQRRQTLYRREALGQEF